MSEVGCEPLVVGPSAEPWTLSLDAPWTERRTVATCWFSRVRVGVSNRRWGPLAGRQCSVRSRWDRRVPVTVGEVAVSLQGRGAAG